MKNKYRCDVELINKRSVQEVKPKLPSKQVSVKIAGNFHDLANLTRLNLLYALAHKELCVCDLACLLSMSQSAISHQLKVLREAKLIKFRRGGKNIYYSLTDRHIL